MDTSSFYTFNEMELHNKINEFAFKKNNNKQDYDKICSKQHSALKSELKSLIKSNVGTRLLNPSALKSSNIVAMFDSNSTRTFGMKQGELTTDIFIVRVYFFDILRDLIRDGFMFGGEKYVYFTSSAGQIRTKKTVFIKEALWAEHQRSIMCGLTIDEINKRGGINANKFLSYLALCNGATDDIYESIPMFNLHKAVVIDDFESFVTGEVDYIDQSTYDITRKIMDIPVNHTDGAGMILPRIKDKNLMIRLPWIKGLLSPFPFDEFCREYNCNGDIVDIYGKIYNIFDDDIEVIFTKSQFKAWKYYDSWQNYVEQFYRYRCRAGVCNEEKSDARNARFNYQMLQTLVDINDAELKHITRKARTDIENISRDRKTMLKVFGVTSYNHNKNYLQRALEVYPEMLADNYCKDILKMIKKKCVKMGLSAKFEVHGKYTFIVPDMYAFCERLFLGHENPKGLLKDGDVFCRMYPDSSELDCLRSPHLFAEHAVRHNVVDAEKKRWFQTRGLYTSSHDLISKLLQFDVDGDMSLVCADETIVNVAKRNMSGIVPLYYEMGSASPVEIGSDNLYEGLTFAFANCNIGAISNDITKVWNSEDINLDVIRLLCVENNFLIDAAKTLTKLDRPNDTNKIINAHIKNKLPAFFVHAKDKKRYQVEGRNGSAVNRLPAFIPNKRIVFKKGVFDKFDYKMLMSNRKTSINHDIVAEYLKLRIDNKFNIHFDDLEHSNMHYIYREGRKKLLGICGDVDKVVNCLVKYLYGVKQSTQKEFLWFAFGEELLKNLQENLEIKYGVDSVLCEGCVTRIRRKNNRQKFCDVCWVERERKLWRENKAKNKKFQV